MEFFEQAHVAKGDESTKRNSKSEENMKKQLKKMLYGYKKSDNELIKSSLEAKVERDDSSSVSAFSDLNLTISSADTTQATIGSDDDIDSIPEEFNTNYSQISDTRESESPLSGSNTSLVGDSERSLDLRPHGSLSSSTPSIENVSLSASLITNVDSEGSEQFDPDGSLALIIHKKLKCSDDSPKHVVKRKLEDDSLEKLTPRKVKSSSKTKRQVSTSPRILHPRFIEPEVCTIETDNSSESISKSSVLSPQYVSVDVEDAPSESFSDVLGEYKYPTVRNVQDKETFDLINDFIPLPGTRVTTITDDEEELTCNVEEITDDTFPEGEIEEDRVAEAIQSDTETNQGMEIEDSSLITDDVQTEQNVHIYRPKDSVDILLTDDRCICVMKYPSKLFLHGKVKVSAIAGIVEVFGHILTQQPHELYAPYNDFAQCLSTVDGDYDAYGMFNKLTSAGLSKSEANSIITKLDEYDAVVILEKLNSATMDFVEDHFSVANLFSKPTKHIVNYHAEAFEKIGCCIYLTEPQKIFEVPLSWREINKYSYEDRSRGIICGGKGVGKSTCLRYHVNRLLTHGPVLLIDLDPGQCELTVAGNISATVVKDPLLGPNFTHIKRPERALNLGMINTMDSMRRYVNAVISLIAYCANDERLSNMRWIINTMGMCNSVGLHFITTIIIHSKPTYLFQIDSKNLKKRYDMFLRPQTVLTHFEDYKNSRLFAKTTYPDNLDYGFILCHHTENPARNNNSLIPRDQRYLNFLAYFGQLLRIHRGLHLQGITPYEVQLQDLCVYMNVKIPEGTVTRVINGKIVALCQHVPGSIDKKTYVLAEEPLLCLGHGLIRGIDFDRGILYVITPLGADELQSVDTLLYADWVPELRGQEKHLPSGTSIPYRMQTMYQQKQLMFTPRRRFNPLQLLKMTKGS